MPDHTLPPIAVTVDLAAFTIRDGTTSVVLIQRGNDPFRGAWALPGGFVEPEEDLAEAAVREMAEETGLQIPVSMLTQLGAYGAPGRDPRGRVVSVVFWAFLEDLADPVGGSDAAAARLLAIDAVMAGDIDLAFDHHLILGDALRRLRGEGATGPG